ncbi:MAG TPA: hypothetical protein VG276_09205 [Actinomycetes bacterium]|jgi:hypothetical protein|nr:hypothetical protein [Actinomycetes bacterium]
MTERDWPERPEAESETPTLAGLPVEALPPDGDRVVELSFDASGRIGTARWLATGEQRTSQDERQRTGL